MMQQENQNKIPPVQQYVELDGVPSKQLAPTKIEKVVMTKSKQFKFDCGVFMARITEDIDSNFGLKYHFINSTSLESFIESVGEFIKAADNGKLTDGDIAGLTRQYDIGVKQKIR